MSSQIAWKPNWIDYRTSIGNVDRRTDRGEKRAEIPTCPECGCEADVVPVAHSPKCPTLAAEEPRRRPSGGGSGDGLELLERMDRGEPVAADDDDLVGPDDAELEETAEAGSMGRSADAVSSSPGEDGLEEASGARSTAPGPSRAAAGGSGPPAGAGRLLEPEGSPPGPADAAASQPQEARSLVDGDGGARSKLDRGAGQRLVLAALIDGLSTAAAITEARYDGKAQQVSAFLRALVDKGLARKVRFGVFEATDEGRAAFASGALLDVAREKLGRAPGAFDDAPAAPPRNGSSPARPDSHPLKVPGTGLCYRNALEAFAAADEVEHDGERVARAARDDGDEGRADQAIDAALALAEDIRGAARVFEERQNGSAAEPVAEVEAEVEVEPEPAAELEPEPVRGRGGRRPTWTREAALEKLLAQAVDGVAPARAAFLLSGISNAVVVRLFGSYTNMVNEAGLTSILAARFHEPPPRLMVTPEEMAPFQRSLTLALIAGMRAAADALEQELD